VPTPETLAVLKLVEGFAPEPGELVVVGADCVEPPPQAARSATTPNMPPATKIFGAACIEIPPTSRYWR
jgi:hypothetical protein